MSGNGVDIGAVYQFLKQVADIAVDQGRKLDRLDARVQAVERRLDDPANGLTAVRRAVNDQAASLAVLRRTVTEYHSAVLGHGIVIS